MSLKVKTVFAVMIAFVFVLSFAIQGVPQGPQDWKAKARIKAEEHFRQERLTKMKEATTELIELTKVLVKEVEAADGYTISATIVENSDRIEKLAKKIEDLAKQVKRQARGR